MTAIPVYKNEVLEGSMYGGDVMMGKGGVNGVKDKFELIVKNGFSSLTKQV